MPRRQITRSICMVAYANYFNDARIKNYVGALLNADYQVDVFALGRSERPRPGLRVVALMSKIASSRALPYVLSQLWFLLLAFVFVSLAYIRRRYSMVHVHN